ncbi:MAG: right-handed parallel beta-helix repeat-containing protein [Planctomycetaceae bacterium]|nr:right-handed parallel beta-helix repeat-containing protein [Planctomycetaceae bacterium]
MPEPFRQTGPLPTLVGDGTLNPVITIANNSVVRGFNFDAANAIFGQNVTNFTLECLRGDVLNGINIQNGHGMGIINDVEFDVLAGGTGIRVTNTTGPLLTLDAGNITTRGGVFGTYIGADGGDILFNIQDLTSNGATNAGLYLQARQADLSGSADTVIVSSMPGSGVVVDLSEATGSVELNNLVANNNGVDGLRAIADDGTVFSLGITNSTLSGNADDNLDTDSVDSSEFNLFVDPTFLVGAGDNGWEFMVANDSILNARFLDVTASGNTNDALHGNVFSGSLLRLDFDNVVADLSGDDGLDLTVSGDSDVLGNLRDVNFARSGDTGMRLDIADSSNVDLVLNNINSSGNGNIGFDFDVRGGALGASRLDVLGFNLDLDNNFTSQVNGNARNGSIANVIFNTATGDNLANNGGVVLNAETAGKINLSWTNGSISNVLSDGVRATATGNASRIDLTFNNVNINDNAQDGIDMMLTNGGPSSRLNLTLRDSEIRRNGMDGVDYEISGNNARGTIIQRNTAITGNSGDGFQFDVTRGADLVANATGIGNNRFNNNLSNAFQGTVDGIGSTAVVTVSDANADNSGHVGAYFMATNGGRLTFNYSDTNAIDGNQSSLSNSQRDGMFVGAHNAGIANINLNSVLINNNGQGPVGGGDGITAFADSNGVINFDLTRTTVDGNEEHGLFFDARDGGLVTVEAKSRNAPSPAGSFSNNGSGGIFSGVRGNVTDRGRASVSFDSIVVDSNSNDGYEFTVSGGSNFVGEILNSPARTQTASASNNSRNGITLIANDAGTNAALVMENGGNVNDNIGDGLFASATDIGRFAVQVSGNFDRNGDDGIRINSNNVGRTAIEFENGGMTSASDNMGDGVQISLNDTTLIDIPVTTLTQTEVVEAFHINGATVSGNGGDGIVVTGQMLTVDRFEISDSTVEDHGTDGIRLSFSDSTFNRFVLDNNTVVNNNGNGIFATFLDGQIGTMQVTNNSIGGNGNHGFLLNLNNNPIGTLNVSDNVIGVVGSGMVTPGGPLDDSLPVIRPGFDLNTLASNDDGSTGAVPLGFTANFFGQIFQTAFVNNNGNITFDSPLATFTPFGLLNTTRSIIAPFFADVDTRDVGGTMTADVTYGTSMVNGQTAFGVNWVDVRHFDVNGNNQGLPTNSFQLVLIDRSDVNPGDFDIEFNYEQVLWESGEASGSDAFGLGGSSATVGYSNGITTAFELPGSAVNGAFLDGGPAATSLIQNSLNSMNNGRYVFFARDGDISGDGGEDTVGNGMNGTFDGIQINAVNGSDIGTLTMDGNEITSNTGRGIAIRLDDSEIGQGSISDNEIDGNGSHGLHITADNASVNNLAINMNLINNNGGDGIRFDFTNSPLNNLSIEDNPDINDNAMSGINFQMVNSDITGLSINNNGMGVINTPTGPAFDIEIAFGGGLTPSQQMIFAQAEQRWESIITADVMDFGTIDDVVISASGVAIDGAGGILGQAGPTGLRPGSFLPFQGIMQFDTADLAALEAAGELDEVILHEMAHVLGFGTIWDDLNLLTGAGSNDPRFVGTGALAEYNNRFNVNENGVPVENQGGPGTADSHWRETVYNNELMTGFLNSGQINPISSTTIASFGDLGYVVDLNQADPFLIDGSAVPSIADPGYVFRPNDSVMQDAANVDLTAIRSLRRNGMHGINISLTDSSLTGGVISNNLITDSAGGDGIRVVTPSAAASTIELDFTSNMILDNTGGRGIGIELRDNAMMTSAITDNEITGNGAQAIEIDLQDNATINVTNFTGNTLSGNTGAGLEITATDNTNFDVDFGSGINPAEMNTIDANGDAGIAINLSGNVTADLAFSNLNVTNTTDGPDPSLTGEGIAIRLQDNAAVNNLRIGHPVLANTSFTGNAGNGVLIEIDGFSQLPNPMIQNIESSGNGGDGIHIERHANAVVDNFVIRDSIINANSDGIDLTAELANINDEYSIERNDISNNALRGIAMSTQGDAQMEIDVLFNTINNNGSHGIQTNAAENNLSDEESFTGNWLGNQINNNGGNGIQINSVYGFIDNTTIPLVIGALGTNANGNSFGNEIRGNAGHGIDINNTAGSAEIVNNTIAENGLSGIDVGFGNFPHILLIQENSIVDNTMHGINLFNDAETTNVIGFRSITAVVDNNEIRRNGRDGIQILSSSGDRLNNGAFTTSRSFVDVDIINGNMITDNGGRGVDVLVRGSGIADVNIDQAFISRNDEEGVYAVVTSDVNQDNEVSANQALLQGGSIFNDPLLIFNMSNSMVVSNSSAGGYDGAGLVLRVGTSGADFTAGNPNTWAQNNTVDPLIAGGLFASVDNNEMRDNFGVDLWIHTFNSTGDPNTTAGAWTDQNENPRNNGNDVFDVDSYQQDPLARITFASFSGNTGGSVDVFGISDNGLVTNNQDFAFYNNAEDVFKSRTQGQDNNTDGGMDDDGPFNSGTRQRNATRLPGRGTLPPDLTILGTGGTLGSSDFFLYPGVGESTLRIGVGSDLDLSTSFDQVLTDFTDLIFLNQNGNINPFITAYEWEVF